MEAGIDSLSQIPRPISISSASDCLVSNVHQLIELASVNQSPRTLPIPRPSQSKLRLSSYPPPRAIENPCQIPILGPGQSRIPQRLRFSPLGNQESMRDSYLQRPGIKTSQRFLFSALCNHGPSRIPIPSARQLRTPEDFYSPPGRSGTPEDFYSQLSAVGNPSRIPILRPGRSKPLKYSYFPPRAMKIPWRFLFSALGNQ
jgi:hypothetical protein